MEGGECMGQGRTQEPLGPQTLILDSQRIGEHWALDLSRPSKYWYAS